MKSKKILLTALLALSAAGMASCGESGIKVKIWCSESSGVKEQFEKQIAAFNTVHKDDGYAINATVEGVSEADAATNMITDVSAGADIYCFAQDQTARLITAKALTKLSDSAKKWVAENNDDGSITAVSSGDAYYAYPLTSDNGYYMYYDKRVVPEADKADLAKIVKDCEDAGKNFVMENGTSGWYEVAWFFAKEEGKSDALCTSSWTTDSAGKFTAVTDTITGANGLIGCQGMAQLVHSKNFVSKSTAAEFSAGVPAGVVISGTWEYTTAHDTLGDNLGCAELPYYTVGGKKYHMGSFSGNKLLGIKPQTDANKAAALTLLAQYLTGAECQEQRFDEFQWGPSNKTVQASSKVKAAPHLAALAAQNNYAVPQGQIAGDWWAAMKALANSVISGSTDADYTAAMATYQAAVQKCLEA